MKFALVFDPHLSDKAPSTRKDNYREAILQKLQFIIDCANREGCKALIIAGDIFHRKIPSHNSHSLISRLISLFGSFNGSVLVVAGNHDISGNMANLWQQPIFVLHEAGVLRILANDPEAIVFQDNDLSVSINGIGFSGARDKKDSCDLYNLNHANADVKIGVFHQMILPDGETFFADYINFSDLVGVNSDIIIDGHYHVGFDPTMIEQDGKYFINGGSLSRGSSDLVNLTKTPRFSMLDIVKANGHVSIQCTDVVVPHKKAEEIFDMQAVARRKEVKELKLFVQNLSEFEVASLTSASPESIIRNLVLMGMPSNLSGIAEHYLTLAHERLN